MVPWAVMIKRRTHHEDRKVGNGEEEEQSR